MKRMSYDASFKLIVIALAKESNNSAAARQHKINEKLVREWRKNESEIEKMPSKMKKRTGGKVMNPEMESDLNSWLLEMMRDGNSVTRSDIKVQAMRLWEANPTQGNFMASTGWCTRFMNRFGLGPQTKIVEELPCKLEENNSSHTAVIVKPQKISSLLMPVKVQCELCSKKFCESYIKEHVASHSDKTPFRCDECDKTFKTEKILSRHKGEVHCPNLFQCPKCPATFKTLSYQKLHSYTHNENEKPYTCPFPDCDKRFRKPSECNYHEITHKGEKPFACHQCESKFNRNNSLKRHVREAHENQPRPKYTTKERAETFFKCNKCSKKFKTGKSLSVHRKLLNHFPKTFECPKCPAVFKKRSGLVNHQLVHSFEKPFSCDQPDCGKSYKTKSDLTRHLQTHNPINKERNHACDQCESRFTAKECLTRHLGLIHTDVKPFDCEYDDCDFKCKRKANLADHYRSVHTHEKIHECDVCDYKTTTASKLRSHKQIKHGVIKREPISEASSQPTEA